MSLHSYGSKTDRREKEEREREKEKREREKVTNLKF